MKCVEPGCPGGVYARRRCPRHYRAHMRTIPKKNRRPHKGDAYAVLDAHIAHLKKRGW